MQSRGDVFDTLRVCLCVCQLTCDSCSYMCHPTFTCVKQLTCAIPPSKLFKSSHYSYYYYCYHLLLTTTTTPAVLQYLYFSLSIYLSLSLSVFLLILTVSRIVELTIS